VGNFYHCAPGATAQFESFPCFRSISLVRVLSSSKHPDAYPPYGLVSPSEIKVKETNVTPGFTRMKSQDARLWLSVGAGSSGSSRV